MVTSCFPMRGYSSLSHLHALLILKADTWPRTYHPTTWPNKSVINWENFRNNYPFYFENRTSRFSQTYPLHGLGLFSSEPSHPAHLFVQNLRCRKEPCPKLNQWVLKLDIIFYCQKPTYKIRMSFKNP